VALLVLLNNLLSLLADLWARGGAATAVASTPGELGAEPVPVKPDNFLTKFFGLNLPEDGVGTENPPAALGVASTAP